VAHWQNYEVIQSIYSKKNYDDYWLKCYYKAVENGISTCQLHLVAQMPTNTSDLAWHFTVTHLIDIIPKFAWIIIKQVFCTGICFQLFLVLFAIPQCKFKHSPCSCHAIKIIPKLAVFIFFNSYTLICVQLYVSQLTKTYKQTVKIYSRVQRLQPLQHQNSTTIDDICVSWWQHCCQRVNSLFGKTTP